MCLGPGLALFAAWGCGGSKETPVKPPPPSINQTDADDIVQQIRVMVSADNGGWFSLIESMNAMLPGILQNSQPFTGDARGWSRRGCHGP